MNDLLHLAIRILKYFHLHPEQKLTKKYFLLRTIWFFGIFIFAIIVTLNSFDSNRMSVRNAQSNSDMILTIAQSLPKLAIFALHKNKLTSHYYEMKTFWKLNEVNIEEADKMDLIKSMRRGVMPLKIFYFGCALGHALYLYNLYYNIDIHYIGFLPEQFQVTYSINIVKYSAMFVQTGAVIFVLTFDTLVVCSCLNLNAQFQIVSQRLKTIINAEEYNKNEFGICIEYHNFLLRCAERIKEVLSFYFACVFLTTLHSLTTQILLLARGADGDQLAKTITFYTIFLLQYSLYCFPMSDLSQAMSEMGNTVYNSNWYLCDNKTKKLIKFIILRCQIPFYITAGGLINVDKTNFTQVFKTSLSFYTIISAMEDSS